MVLDTAIIQFIVIVCESISVGLTPITYKRERNIATEVSKVKDRFQLRSTIESAINSYINDNKLTLLLLNELKYIYQMLLLVNIFTTLVYSVCSTKINRRPNKRVCGPDLKIIVPFLKRT